jgi:hypothetical protein
MLSIPRDPVCDAYEHIGAASGDRLRTLGRGRAVT